MQRERLRVKEQRLGWAHPDKNHSAIIQVAGTEFGCSSSEQETHCKLTQRAISPNTGKISAEEFEREIMSTMLQLQIQGWAAHNLISLCSLNIYLE